MIPMNNGEMHLIKHAFQNKQCTEIDIEIDNDITSSILVNY
jgi:hypothetical protein